MFYQLTLAKIIYIYFIYGLSFFVMGLAIFLHYIQLKKTVLAQDVRWLGAFGIIHGLSEWAVMFTTLKYFLGLPVVFLVRNYAGEVILYLISFICLVQFGIRVISGATGKLRWLGYILPWIGALLVISVGVFIVLPNKDLVLCLQTIERFSRYLICFPGTILAIIGFLLQKNELERIGVKGTKVMLSGVSISFLVYGVAAGLLVNRSSFFPASGLALQSIDIFAVATVPILRSLAGIGIAYFTIRLVSAFNHEYTHSLETIERKQALSRERENISRDLHDGIIQSLYAVGLQIKETAYLTEESPERAKKTLEHMIDRLDGIIRDIRFFIQDLRLPKDEKESLIPRLESQLGYFSSLTQIDVELSAPADKIIENLSPEQADHLYYIVQEALVNVAKHADAKQIYVSLSLRNDHLCLSIIDDGSGMIEKPCDKSSVSGYGVQNIRSRVANLNGQCNWESYLGLGTRLNVVIPISDGNSRQLSKGK